MSTHPLSSYPSPGVSALTPSDGLRRSGFHLVRRTEYSQAILRLIKYPVIAIFPLARFQRISFPACAWDSARLSLLERWHKVKHRSGPDPALQITFVEAMPDEAHASASPYVGQLAFFLS